MLRNPEIKNQEYVSGSHKWKYYDKAKIPFLPVANSQFKTKSKLKNEKIEKINNETENFPSMQISYINSS